MTSRSSGLPLPPSNFVWTPNGSIAQESADAFNALKRWALLKRRLKRAPKMTRKQRTGYLKRLLKKEWP